MSMQEVPPQEEDSAVGEQPENDVAKQAEAKVPEDVGREDEFGIEYKTEYQILEYENWNEVRRITISYGEMNANDRAAVRKLNKYERPARAGGSLASRREDALRGVVDDAQVSLERGEGWDDEDAAAEGGLLGQFEGDMADSDGDELSLSDGVGSSDSQQREMGDSAVGLMEDDEEEEPSSLDGIEDGDLQEGPAMLEGADDDDENAGEVAEALPDGDADLLDDDEV